MKYPSISLSRLVPLVLTISISFMFISCSTQIFRVNGGAALKTKDKAQPFFIGGIGQESELDASKICGGANKIAKVETKKSFLNGLLGGFTFGLYTPRQATVYCRP